MIASKHLFMNSILGKLFLVKKVTNENLVKVKQQVESKLSAKFCSVEEEKDFNNLKNEIENNKKIGKENMNSIIAHVLRHRNLFSNMFTWYSFCKCCLKRGSPE